MDDLIAFITARLDEDEAAAGRTPFRNASWRSADLWVLDGGVRLAKAETPLLAAHMGRHDPARVLREVEAKRAIVRRYQDARDGGEDTRVLYLVIWDLADVWSDHPDYPRSARPHAL